MTPLFGLDNFYNNGAIKKYIGVFGSIFSDIYIQRVSQDSTRTDAIKVPIKYGNGNMYVKSDQGEEVDYTKISRILPAMSFELENVYYDKSRKTNQFNTISQTGYTTTNGVNNRNYQYNRLPYNFIFGLKIRTKNLDDMFQIVEQIIPTFDSNLVITLEDTVNQVNSNQEISITINEIKMDDDYQDEMKSRLIEWLITFELKGFFYKKTITGFTINTANIYFGDIDNPPVITNTSVPDISITTQDPITGKQEILPSIATLEQVLFASADLKNIEAITGTAPKIRPTLGTQ